MVEELSGIQQSGRRVRKLKIALRADASPFQGCGHVLRTLTLATEFIRNGHDAVLFSNVIDVPWLSKKIEASGVPFRICNSDSLDLETYLQEGFEHLVVDSYQIRSESISSATKQISTLAIIDHETRGIHASSYLDHNLGATRKIGIDEKDQMWGPSYALIRQEIAQLRRNSAEVLDHSANPNVLVMIGGTDPKNVSLEIAKAIKVLDQRFNFSFVTPELNIPSIQELLPISSMRILPPTPDIGSLLSRMDLVISAAGTSVLDLSCIGIPSIFISVASNQDRALLNVSKKQIGLAFGQSEEIGNRSDEFRSAVITCLEDQNMRETFFRNAQNLVDGLGANRVVKFLELNS
jgi:spore coat polysaccharide biosynthesis predicted glycosyltransferase SpsG